MKPIYFLVSRISHIATARSIASDYFDKHKKNIVIIGQFSGFERAVCAARRDTIWTTVGTSISLISYLEKFNKAQSDIFIYTDFGMRINYYLYRLYGNSRIHVFQDGSANYLPAIRKFKAFNYIYSLLMGDGFRFENFVGQSRFISSLYLYDEFRFRQIFKDREIKIKSISENFLQSIDTLAEKSYIERYSIGDNSTKEAILYLPGWDFKPILIEYIVKNFNGIKFIKQHPADKKKISHFSGLISIGAHHMGEQVICELLSKFKSVVVILESEASSYVFSEVGCIDFYLASVSRDRKIIMKKLF